MPVLQSQEALVDFVRSALAVARANLPAYSSPKSPRRYTQHQLFAMLALKELLETDYRGVVEALAGRPDLCRALKLKDPPHFSTLYYAEKRLFESAAPEGRLAA